jgi:hypothetical protein
MRYGGRGRTYHLKADCAGSSSPVAADDDAIALAYENRHVGPISDELEQATRESWGDR